MLQSEFEPDEGSRQTRSGEEEHEEGGRTQTAGARVFHESEILFPHPCHEEAMRTSKIMERMVCIQAVRWRDAAEAAGWLAGCYTKRTVWELRVGSGSHDEPCSLVCLLGQRQQAALEIVVLHRHMCAGPQIVSNVVEEEDILYRIPATRLERGRFTLLQFLLPSSLSSRTHRSPTQKALWHVS